jgi:uncharacterized membrane protein
MQAPTVRAQGMANPPQVVKDNMARMQKEHLEKCYGINVVAKNDCAEGTHSCAGQATQARDPKSFVLLPAGDCSKIQGGTPGSDCASNIIRQFSMHALMWRGWKSIPRTTWVADRRSAI